MDRRQLDVWIIEADTDDREIIEIVWKELGYENDLVFLRDAEATMQHLEKANVAPYIILCSVNLPKVDGLALREKIINSNSKIYESVPFIFWSGQASEHQIRQAYELKAHGFFIKEADIEELKETFRSIIRYWSRSKMPSKSKKENGES